MNGLILFACLASISALSPKISQWSLLQQKSAASSITPTLATAILPATNAEKVEDITMALMAGGVESHQCPWVDVKDQKLFVSVSITGEDSWGALVANLAGAGKTKFAIFTGRHGNIPNQVDNKGNKAVDIMDHNHFTEDEGKKAGVLAGTAATDIELIDCSAHAKGHTDWLKKETNKQIKAGAVVIYAWCYSIFSFQELGGVEGVLEPPKLVLESHQKVAIAKTVATLVTEDFNWVE
jgi:hypothetical protein